MACPSDEIGRRSRLKICRCQSRAGSSPASGTIFCKLDIVMMSFLFFTNKKHSMMKTWGDRNGKNSFNGKETWEVSFYLL